MMLFNFFKYYIMHGNFKKPTLDVLSKKFLNHCKDKQVMI